MLPTSVMSRKLSGARSIAPRAVAPLQTTPYVDPERGGFFHGTFMRMRNQESEIGFLGATAGLPSSAVCHLFERALVSILAFPGSAATLDARSREILVESTIQRALSEMRPAAMVSDRCLLHSYLMMTQSLAIILGK